MVSPAGTVEATSRSGSIYPRVGHRTGRGRPRCRGADGPRSVDLVSKEVSRLEPALRRSHSRTHQAIGTRARRRRPGSSRPNVPGSALLTQSGFGGVTPHPDVTPD